MPDNGVIPANNGFLSQLWSQLVSSFQTRTGAWIVATVFTLLTVFSDNLAERIKSALNREKVRESKYSEVMDMSRQLSGYTFDCELIEEFLAKGWTTRDAFGPIIQDYNKDVIDLRRNEYADRAVLGKYWNTKRRDEFVKIMEDVRTLDSKIHELNDEYEKVNILKTQDKVDPARAKSTSSDLHNILTGFTPKVECLFDKLE